MAEHVCLYSRRCARSALCGQEEVLFRTLLALGMSLHSDH